MISIDKPRKFRYIHWDSSRKKQQRKMNAAIKAMNKSIEEDELWRSRFFARQAPRYEHFEMFEDRSGGTMYFPIRFYDKKNKKYVEYWGEGSEWAGRFGYLYFTMNDFIVKDIETWQKDDPDPRDDHFDYRLISQDETIKESVPLYQWPLYFRR